MDKREQDVVLGGFEFKHALPRSADRVNWQLIVGGLGSGWASESEAAPDDIVKIGDGHVGKPIE